jgi:hypothetical protein
MASACRTVTSRLDYHIRSGGLNGGLKINSVSPLNTEGYPDLVGKFDDKNQGNSDCKASEAMTILNTLG